MKESLISKAKKLQNAYMVDCEKLIVEEVKRVMRIHKNLVSYSDMMRSRSFEDRHGNPVFLISSRMNKSWDYVYYPTYKTFKTLLCLYDTLDCESLGITVEKETKIEKR
jgi:hypothetical protein